MRSFENKYLRGIKTSPVKIFNIIFNNFHTNVTKKKIKKKQNLSQLRKQCTIKYRIKIS